MLLTVAGVKIRPWGPLTIPKFYGGGGLQLGKYIFEMQIAGGGVVGKGTLQTKYLKSCYRVH